jgi:hypothetical protein
MKKERSERIKDIKSALSNFGKRLIPPAVFLAVVGILVLVIFLLLPDTVEEIPLEISEFTGEETEYVLENDYLRLVVDAKTTWFELTDKQSGKVWTSNPADADNDALALPAEKNKLKSTLVLTYSTVNGVDTIFDNYAYSILNGLYNIEADDDSITIHYSVGKMEREFILPVVLTEERYNSYIGQMEGNDRFTVLDYYKKYDVNNLSEKDDKEALLETYPMMADGIIYAMRDGVNNTVKGKLEKIFATYGYTNEEYLVDKELYSTSSESDSPVFNIDLIYRLEDQDFVVEVPMEKIEYREKYPLYTLNVLPYFGAAGLEETGSLFVPEGGGSLIYFNNGKVKQDSYYANLYGWDMALGRTEVVHETDVTFGAFGILKPDGSMLCILEGGSSYASIVADISGRKNNYNNVSASYSTHHREQYNMSGRFDGKMFVYEPEIAQDDLVQRYRFSASDDYVTLAKLYQSYLTNRYPTFTPKDQSSTPLTIEILCAVQKTKQILGIPVLSPLVLTDFEEAKTMLADLLADGYKNISVKVSGWQDGGIDQEYPITSGRISELGSAKELKNLTSFAAENGINLYLDGLTQYAHNSGLLEGFWEFTDAARYISKERVELETYSTVYFGPEDWKDSFYFLMRASKITDAMNKLIKDGQDYGAYGISFRDTGEVLSSDFTRSEIVTREMAKTTQSSILQGMAEQNLSLMINRGNDYALPYADVVTNMPLAGSNYSILDAQIPFYQLALHGYISYMGEPLNITGDFVDELLRSAEYGAGLSFTFMSEDTGTLRNTFYTQYFGASFDMWRERAKEVYTEYEADLGHVFNQEMTEHDILSIGVTKTVYEDGTAVYVNYTTLDFETADGLIIPAREYLVIS